MNQTEISKICRLCLYNQDCDTENTLVNVFECEDLVETIFKCTDIKILIDDKLPKNVCNTCMATTLQFYHFKNMCRYSDETLRKCLNAECVGIKNEIVRSSEQECNLIENGEFESISYKDNNKSDCNKENVFKKHNKEILAPTSVSKQSFKTSKKYRLKKSTIQKRKIKIYKIDDSMRQIIGSNVYTCEICYQNFTSFFDYFDHQENHNGHFVFKCFKCEEVFNERKLLVEHDAKHKIPCKICKLEVLPKSMNAHLLIHTDIHKCHECGRRHTSDASLQKHMKARHKGVKGFVCHICGKQSSCQSSMNRHMAYHSNDRPYKCKYCDFTAKSLNIVQVHTSRRHFAEQCVCEICAKLFKSQPSLIQHMKRIHAKRKHVCDICGKAFIERYNLNRHVKKHVGQRLHECRVCNREFFTVRQLKEHMHSHRQGCVNCSKCGKEFFYKKYFDKHVVKCAKGESVPDNISCVPP